jgi:2-isopropylmalate synthase
VGYWPRPDDSDPTVINGEVKVKVNCVEQSVEADGNGPISAFVNAIREIVEVDFGVDNYHEQAVGKGADAQAMAYVPLKLADGEVIFGVGRDSNINQAAVRAIVAGLNRIAK